MFLQPGKSYALNGRSDSTPFDYYHSKKDDMMVYDFDDILELRNDGGHGELFLEGHCSLDNDRLGQNMKVHNMWRLGHGNLNQPHH